MDRIEVLAVVGCGLIGGSWTALFLANGYDVRAWDPDAEARIALPSRVDSVLAQMAESRTPGDKVGRLMVAASLSEAVREASFVQENAPEQVAVKQALYAEIEAAAAPDAILASSTTAFVWSELSARMARPQRLITAHPFNPPHLMPLVELFGHDDASLARADMFYRSVGREPVRLKKEAIGHIANRLQAALWREAVHIVAEGIADVAAVDAALVHGPGLRWSTVGSHLAYHLGGGQGGLEHYLDHLGPSQERRWASLGTPSLTPAIRTTLIEGVRAEASGRSITELTEARDDSLRRVLAARRPL